LFPVGRQAAEAFTFPAYLSQLSRKACIGGHSSLSHCSGGTSGVKSGGARAPGANLEKISRGDASFRIVSGVGG